MVYLIISTIAIIWFLVAVYKCLESFDPYENDKY